MSKRNVYLPEILSSRSVSPRGSDLRGGVYYWVGWDLKAVRTLWKFQATPLFALKTLQGCNLTRARDRRRANSRGTQRENSSKPLKHSIVKPILVFKR